MYRFSLLLFALAVPQLPQAVAAKDTAPSTALVSSGPWRLDQGASTCALEASFGSGKQSVILGISQGAGVDTVDLTIGGMKVPKSRTPVEVTLLLGASGTQFRQAAFAVPASARPERFIRLFDIDLSSLKQTSGEQDIAIAAGADFATTLTLRDPAKALESLAACYDRLLTSWGIDPKQTTRIAVRPRRLGTPAQTNPGLVTALFADSRRRDWVTTAWVTPMDYPTAALREERSGVVVAALSLDSTGSVRQCRVVSSSGFAPLDQRTCEVFTARARYAPGLDATGKAFDSNVLERVIWTIPAY